MNGIISQSIDSIFKALNLLAHLPIKDFSQKSNINPSHVQRNTL